MRRLKDLLADYGGASMKVNMHVENAYAMLEQGEFGQPLEDAVADIHGRGPVPPDNDPQTTAASLPTMPAGSASQRARSAPDDNRPALADSAHQAVRRLQKMATTPCSRPSSRVSRADLLLWKVRRSAACPPRPDAALRSDAPMVAFDVARTRARASRALGHRGEAGAPGPAALGIPVDQGWPHRARWISAEFAPTSTRRHDPDRGGRRRPRSPRRPASTGSGCWPCSSQSGPRQRGARPGTR